MGVVVAPNKPPDVPDGAPVYAPSSTVEDFIHACASGPLDEFRVLQLMASKGEGKSCRDGTPVLTPAGWVKIEDLREGDAVIAGDGSTTTVSGVYPQPSQPLWRVCFSDGASTVVTDEHLWGVQTYRDRLGQNGERHVRGGEAARRRPYRPRPTTRRGVTVVTTYEIRARLVRRGQNKGDRWSVPLVGVVRFPGRQVSLDGYLLGVILGDGGLTSRSQVRLTSADDEVLDAVRSALPVGCALHHITGPDYRIAGSGRAGGNAVLAALLRLGLMGHRAWEKFVPESYLWNGAETRLAVLQGLLDTDGTILKHSNSVSYATTSQRLAEDVSFLVRSLGGLAVTRERWTHYTYKGERRQGRISYHVSIRLPNGVSPFRLTRKLARVRPKGLRNRPVRFITGCEPAGEERSTCIAVAHPGRLYVIDDFVVTHNTTAVLYALIALGHRLEQEGLRGLLPLRVAVIRDTWENLKRALALDALVLTPTGWIKAGDVALGDTLIAADGTPTKVLGVYPQPEQPLWRLTFSDGTAAVSTDDHIWAAITSHYRKGYGRRRSGRGGKPHRPLHLTTTKDIRERLSRTPTSRWALPLLSAPAQFRPQPVPLDPYLLGALLGDGCFTPPSIRLTTADQEVVDRVRVVVPAGIEVRHQEKYAYVLKGSGKTNPVMSAVRQLGLVRHRAWEKFVPPLYLWNSADIRHAVLQGLLDTDGHAKNSQVLFTTTSSRLADDVVFLAQSLGGTAKIQRRGPAKGSRRHSYRVTLRLPEPVRPFRLSRKSRVADQRRARRHRPIRYITNCEPAGQGPAVCFRVESPDGLFVINDFIVTHNTTIATIRKQAAKGVPIEFFDGDRQCLIGKWAHLFFFGVDTRKDVDKLQGFECAVLWPEEVAPGADLDIGIPAEVFGIGATCVRQEGVPHRILMTFNPPDEDHWCLTVDKALKEKGIAKLIFHRFTMPPGERSEHFRTMAVRASRLGRFKEAAQWTAAAEEFDLYRQLNEAFLESVGRHDLVARLAHGKVGGVQMGEAIVSTFNYEMHVTAPGERLVALPSAQMFRAWDGGLTPSVVFAQHTAAGNLDVLGSRTSVNAAMGQHVLNEAIPFQEKYKLFAKRQGDGFVTGSGAGGRIGWDFRDIGDPSLFEGDKVNNANQSAGLAIENMLGTILEPGPIEWASRRDAGNLAFERKGHGRQARMLVRIQRDENDLMIKGLNGRAHYVIDMATGRINPDIKAAKRASGLYFQSLDALLYLLAVLWPAHEWLRQHQRNSRPPGGPDEPRDWVGA